MADAREMFSTLPSPGCLALSLEKKEECGRDGVGRMGGEFKHFWDVLINGQRPGWKEISCALCVADPEQAHLAAPSV